MDEFEPSPLGMKGNERAIGHSSMRGFRLRSVYMGDHFSLKIKELRCKGGSLRGGARREKPEDRASCGA